MLNINVGTTPGKYSGYGSLSGSVKREGSAVRGFVVYLLHNNQVIQETVTDHLGQYQFLRLNVDLKYDVVVHDPSGVWESQISTRRQPQ